METNSPTAGVNTKSVTIPRILTLEKRLTVILAQDEDTYCAFCPELDLVTAMPQAEEALEDLIEAMKDYADEYLGEIELYGKSPNRAHHLPYIKAIASCENDWDIKMMLEFLGLDSFREKILRGDLWPKEMTKAGPFIS